MVTDTETFQRKRTFVGHTKLITSIACHPHTEDLFTTSSCDGTLKQWSMQDPSKEVSQILLEKPAWCVSYSVNGDYLVTASETGTIALINCNKAGE